jgi:6-pyruvoyltetrahydropterin/6-carboxytetrahydropterin synthase
MFRVSREIDFCYGHRLLNHGGKCRHLHGHSARAVVTLQSPTLDGCGMVLDFAEIKRVVGGWIDERFDHRMILQRSDPLAAILQEQGEPVVLIDEHPTAENLARLIYEFTLSRGFPIVECQLWESTQSWAAYSTAPQP